MRLAETRAIATGEDAILWARPLTASAAISDLD
jgi:hypothetical protein